MVKINNFSKKSLLLSFLLFLCLTSGVLALKFRNSTLDDDLYLFETSIMADALKKGEWIGNYAVGVHGFLFKLPIALVFLLTGPVMNIAVIWNILIACVSLYLFFLILKEIFKKDLVAFSGTLLLFANFQFILNLPTYMREMSVLFAVLLFIYLLVKKKPYWILGLSLLLILDAKESVFFMILPGYLLSVLINEWKGFNWKCIWNYVKTYFQLLIPTVIFLVMMLFTQLIPLNTVIFTLIPGVTEGGVEYQMKHFEKEAATQSIVRLQNPEAATVDTLIPTQKDEIVEKSFSNKVLDTLQQYIGKVLYPRTFSFLSIPGIIFFPAFFTSIALFKKALQKRKRFFISLALMMWSFITVYILRLSFDRYLFPITPVVLYFFVVFLRDIVKNRNAYLIIWGISSLLSLLSLLFEAEYIIVKFLLSAIAITLLAFYILFRKKSKTLYFYLCILLSILTCGVGLFFYYSSGQLKMYRDFGNDYEVEKVISYFSKDENIMLNDVGWDLLPGIYRGNNQYNPEWKWKLKDWVPRKKYLKMLDTTNTFLMVGKSVEEDKSDVEKYNIDKIVLTISTIDGIQFKNQDRLDEYLGIKWLNLRDRKQLKNKEVYIFEVIK